MTTLALQNTICIALFLIGLLLLSMIDRDSDPHLPGYNAVKFVAGVVLSMGALLLMYGVNKLGMM